MAADDRTSGVEWTAAERGAVGRAVHEHDANASMSGVEWPTWDDLGDEGRAAYGDLAEDILDALAPFVAARGAQAAAKALNSAADDLPRLTEGPGQAGTATWPAHDRAIYSLAVEESQDALRARADRCAQDTPWPSLTNAPPASTTGHAKPPHASPTGRKP